MTAFQINEYDIGVSFGWIVFLHWLGWVYLVANVVFAIRDPKGWATSNWTARRGVRMDGDDAWTEGDIRAWGAFFGCVAVGWLYILIGGTAKAWRT